jgi:HlyD family secretion protein
VLKWLLGLFLAVVLGLAAGGYFIARTDAFREMVSGFNPGDRPLEVRIGKVEKGTLTRTVNAAGSIEPKTKVQISAQVSARITAIPLREGEAVKKGDVIVRLDDRDLAARLESSQASLRAEQARLEGNRATLARAEAEASRQRELTKTGDAAKAVLENAESDYLRAKSAVDASLHNIEIARANIAQAQKDLDNTVIRAPFDGLITKRNAEVGELVVVGTLNNAASVIMEIADLNVMLMKARVDEANIAPIKAGQKARIFINAFSGKAFDGVVERVDLARQTDRDGTGYFLVEIAINKPEETLLRQGLQANTDLEVETFYDVLKLPSQAIVDRRVDELPKSAGESPLVDRTKAFARLVYRVVDGKTVATPVSVGSSDLTHSIILAGLSEGDDVVVGPFKVLTDLRDGRKVVQEGTLKKDADAKKAGEAGTDPAAKSEGSTGKASEDKPAAKPQG